MRDPSADRAALFAGWRLDHERQRGSTLGLVLADIGDVEAGQADQEVAAVAVERFSIGARTNTAVGSDTVEAFRTRSSVALDLREASALSGQLTTACRSHPSHRR